VAYVSERAAQRQRDSILVLREVNGIAGSVSLAGARGRAVESGIDSAFRRPASPTRAVGTGAKGTIGRNRTLKVPVFFPAALVAQAKDYCLVFPSRSASSFLNSSRPRSGVRLGSCFNKVTFRKPCTATARRS